MSHRPYLPIEPALVDHPKTRALAKLWGCHPYTAVGFLVKLWGYCLEYQDDGNVDGRPADVLDDLAAPCVATSIGTMPTVRDALLKSGFINEDGTLHDWDEYAGALVERRRKDRRRKQLARRRGGEDGRQTSSGQGADRRGNSAPRVEKSRVEKSRVEKSRVEKSIQLQQQQPDYATRCCIAVNGVLEQRLAGVYRTLTPGEHGDQAALWEAAGIPVDLAVEVLRARAWDFHATPLNRQPHTLRYFDAAVREAWAKRQAEGGPAGLLTDADRMRAAAAAEREREQAAR